MSDSGTATVGHSHVFLGAGHEKNERRTWIVIALCTAMMIAEIVGGALFGSIALIADGLHMSTHAGALLLAALAYTYARKHAEDPSFAFGTGKIGDLAGYTSAIVLAMIALLIAYEAVDRLLHPISIDFNQAIPIAAVGLAVNIVSAWLLSGGDHGHSHSHGHAHEGHDDHDHAEDIQTIQTSNGRLCIEIFERDVPPRFRVKAASGLAPTDLTIETLRPGGVRQIFTFVDRGDFLESNDEIAEPHAFSARLKMNQGQGLEVHTLEFSEHDHDAGSSVHHRDNNMRAAFIHVLADAAVSVLVIAGLVSARSFGWLFMDPLAGLIGAAVIANWSWGLVQDTGAILLDRSADVRMEGRVRKIIENDGDRIADFHLWRLGPGHLGVILSVVTRKARDSEYYRKLLSQFPMMSHLTVEIVKQA